MLTEQPSGQLHKQHHYKQITSNKREEQSQGRKRKENIMQQQHHQLNATVNRKKDKTDHIVLLTQ
jgi:hypothetical protein